MSCLFGCVSSSSNPERNVTSDKEFYSAKVEKDLQEGSIPKIPTKHVYKKGICMRMCDCSVKTIEQVVSLTVVQEIVPLFDKSIIYKHKMYNYLHVGSVQIAVVPLLPRGLNVSVLLCLRDSRRNDSIFGMVESSLSNGRVYFHCFPNYQISLSEPNVLDSLTLNVKAKNLNMRPGTHPLDVFYRVKYKVITTNSNIGALYESSKGETLFYPTDPNTHAFVPTTIKWDQVVPPPDWNIQPEALNPKEENPDAGQAV